MSYYERHPHKDNREDRYNPEQQRQTRILRSLIALDRIATERGFFTYPTPEDPFTTGSTTTSPFGHMEILCREYGLPPLPNPTTQETELRQALDMLDEKQEKDEPQDGGPEFEEMHHGRRASRAPGIPPSIFARIYIKALAAQRAQEFRDRQLAYVSRFEKQPRDISQITTPTEPLEQEFEKHTSKQLQPKDESNAIGISQYQNTHESREKKPKHVRIEPEFFMRAWYEYKTEQAIAQQQTEPEIVERKSSEKIKTIYITNGNSLGEERTDIRLAASTAFYYDVMRLKRLHPTAEAALVTYTSQGAIQCLTEGQFIRKDPPLSSSYPYLYLAYEIGFRMAQQAQREGFTPRIVLITPADPVYAEELPRIKRQIILNSNISVDHIMIGELPTKTNTMADLDKADGDQSYRTSFRLHHVLSERQLASALDAITPKAA